MQKLPEFPLTVFYDGSCHVCSTEMFVYMRKDHGGRLEFVDISDPGFNPHDYSSSLDDFMAQMHAIDRSGTVFRGVDAFQAIWRAFPGVPWFRFLAALTGFPLIRQLACLAYRIIRPLEEISAQKEGRLSYWQTAAPLVSGTLLE